ncbi:MAG: ABC transporter ATP-binding protein [Nakamurella sp.]
MLTLDSVTVRYGEMDAVSDMSFAAADGEWLGLIGPNGAGKSTLIRAIASLQKFDGTIHVGTHAIRSLSRRQLARLIAYVPQQPEMPAGMTVLDYALLGRTPHIGYLGTESSADRRHCATLLERLGIGHLAERMLPTLSGGELQRAALSRALAQQAPVLLLDEPTSSLDLGNRIDALELVDDLRLERNITVVSAIHDLTLAAQFADRLLLMVDGQAVASGPPADVLDAEVLSHHFGGNVHIIKDESGALIVAPVRAHMHLAALNRNALETTNVSG